MRFSMSKYKNKKVLINGIEFDSQKEASRYWELWLMEQNGVIKDLELQKKFELIPKQELETPRYGKNGRLIKSEKPVSYIADFVYWDNEKKKEVVEDTKGFRTPEYIIKRKLMKKVYGIEVVEI